MLRFATCLIVSLACANVVQAQSAPATIQPGTYDLQITYGGGVMEGTLEVRAPRRDSIAITLMVSGHESPVRAGRRQGNKLALESTSPGTTIHYDLEFSGETVSGPFTYGDGGGTVTGRRRRTGN